MLREEMSKRIKINPRYSIRAFAKFLNITHSSLINVLKHDLDLSRENFIKVATKLQWDDEFIKSTLKGFSTKRSQLAMKKDPLLSDPDKKSLQYSQAVLKEGQRALKTHSHNKRPLVAIKVILDEEIIKQINTLMNSSIKKIKEKADARKSEEGKMYYCLFYVFPEV